jgi:hypothetical protein
MQKTLSVLLTVLILPLIFFTLLNAKEVRKIVHEDIPLSGDEILEMLPGGGSVKKIPSPARLLQVGTVIDSTTMDHQCNGNIHQRIATVGDSALHATAMISYDMDTGYATRGMKYFHYSAGAFTPLGYVEGTGFGDQRGGYGSVIGYYPPGSLSGNIAMVASHPNLDGRAFGPHWYLFQDAFQGIGAFTPYEGPIGDGIDECDDYLWPSIYVTNDSVGNMAMLGRSNITGCAGAFDNVGVTHKTISDLTWSDVTQLIVPAEWWNGPDIPTLAGADNGYFAIATDEWQTNIYFWESTDAGVTWSDRQSITGYPTGVQFVTPDSTSTQYRPMQNAALAVSPGGTPHVIWTEYQARGASPSDSTWQPGLGLWQYRTKLSHWDPVNGINEVYRHTVGLSDTVQGTAFAYNVGHIAIGFGPTDDIIYAVYEGFVDADVDTSILGGFGFGDIYVSMSTDGGATWEDRVNITNSMGSDDLYPSIARNNPQGIVQEMPGFSVGNADGINDFVMIYQNDDVAGTFMRGNEPGPNFDMLLVAPVDFATISVAGIGDDVNNGGSKIPKAFALSQNYPNPFNPSTVISYQLSESAQVSIRIHNVRGQVIRELVSGEKEAGEYSVQWNGKDQAGQRVSSGIYLYTLETDKGFSSTKKMVVLK